MPYQELPSRTVESSLRHIQQGASTPLVAVKLYAMDLVALLLPGQDHALRDAARDVRDADSLRTWIERCADEIARRNHPERAELFRVRVASQLPPDFLPRIAA